MDQHEPVGRDNPFAPPTGHDGGDAAPGGSTSPGDTQGRSTTGSGSAPWDAPVPPPPSGYEAVPPPAGGPSYAGGPTYGGGPAATGGPTYGGGPSYAGGPAHGQQPTYAQPSYGQPSYGQPAYSQAPYGQPAGHGSWMAPPPLDGFAVASLVLSLVGVVTVGFSALWGIVFGILSLRRIRRNGTRGRGMAIAGITIGSVIVLLAAAGIVAAAVFAGRTSGPTSTGSAELGSPFADDGALDGDTLPDYTLRTDLDPGTCLLGSFADFDLDDVESVDCAVPHDAEIVTLLPMDAPVSLSLEDYDPVYDGLLTTCEDGIDAAAPGAQGDDVWAEVYYPHPDEWDGGGRQSYCLLISMGTDLEGSVAAGDLAPAAGSTT